MIDIDVVKKGSRTWLWILMLVMLALIFWFVMTGSNTPQTGSMLDAGGPFAEAAPALVSEVRV
jgi:hypothetical protein